MNHPSLILYVLALTCAASARANVKLPALFSDHTVVQADTAVPIWGWAEPGEEVTVDFATQSKTTKAGADGKWMVKLDRLATGDKAQALTVKGKNTLTVKDVLVGEVWLGSGQSNMALSVEAVKNAPVEIAAAKFPALRMFKETSGPLPAGHQIRGNEVVLSFTHADGGLVARGGELQGFVIAGEDKQWVKAATRIEGSNVIVCSPEIAKPVAVRYAWENNPVSTLHNGAGLPASPFRTDDWK